MFSCFGVGSLVLIRGIFGLVRAATRSQDPVSLAADPEEPSSTRRSNLSAAHQAALNGYLPELQEALRSGVHSVNQPSVQGIACLQYAASKGRLPCVDFLLSAGADVNQRSSKGSSAMLEAAANGHMHVVARLIQAGADIHIGDDGRVMSPLRAAVCRGHTEVVRFFLSQGADPDAAPPRTNQPLLTAAKLGFDPIIVLLADAGARLDIRNVHGMTALHIAVQNNRPGSAETLLRLGCDAQVPEAKHAWTARDLALKQNKMGMVALIDQFSAAARTTSSSAPASAASGAAFPAIASESNAAGTGAAAAAAAATGGVGAPAL